MPHELHSTEIALLAFGVMLFASVIASRLSRRSGVPVLVLFLGLGMLAGSEGIGGLAFENYSLTYLVGTVALVLILFDGGLRTPVSVVRTAIAPASVLATVGVLVTAAIVGFGAHALGLPWSEALLLGAIVSSTDAAAVFSVLRGGGVHLEERVGALVEVESGLNDPMAALLTIALVSASTAQGSVEVLPLIASVAVQLLIGAVVGAAIGAAGRWMVSNVRVRVGGLYPVVTLAFAFTTYGAASLAHGSGFLAVYVAGVAIGNARMPSGAALLRVHDFIAWAGQIVMFVVLGLLVFPSRVLSVAPMGLGIAAILVFVARPLAVALCLAPFGFRAKEIVLVGWVGLRGAVPIILAVIPVLGGVEGAERLFDVVFFVVVVSAVLQGGSAKRVTEWLGLSTAMAPRPEALLEIISARPLHEEIVESFVDARSPLLGKRLSEITFPPQSTVMLVVRGDSLVAPKGTTQLLLGDHFFVLCPHDREEDVRRLLGAVDAH